MAPATELLEERETSTAVGEEIQHPQRIDTAANAPAAAIPAAAPYPFRLFEEALLDMSTTRPRHRTADFVISVVSHGILLTILLLIPLYFTEGIDLKHFYQTMLVAPPPPPPPPAPVARAITKIAPPKRVFVNNGKLIAPTVVPRTIAMIKEQPIPPDMSGAGVVGGVPGGVPGGQASGVIGGIISGGQHTFVPPPPVHQAPKAPIRVGGRVKPPRLIFGPSPSYPALAKLSRVEGDVLIDAVIDAQGNVVQMQVVSGHSLLVPAALAALSQWKYEPTYLNEQPVPVQFIVTVRFSLSK